jgi:hypothetical protein
VSKKLSTIKESWLTRIFIDSDYHKPELFLSVSEKLTDTDLRRKAGLQLGEGFVKKR